MIYFGIKYFSEIESFSWGEYPEISIISILSLKAGCIVSSWFAVAINTTFDRSKGIPK